MSNGRLSDIINQTVRLESEYAENFYEQLAVSEYEDSFDELEEIFE